MKHTKSLLILFGSCYSLKFSTMLCISAYYMLYTFSLKLFTLKINTLTIIFKNML